MARSLIICSLSCEAAVALVSLAFLILVAVQDGAAPTSDRLISAVGTLGICGVVIWAISDAKRGGRRQQPDGMSTVEEQV